MFDYAFIDFEFDSNGDGYPDTIMDQLDVDGDGTYETIQGMSDVDGDGIYETLFSVVDTDNNGQYDAVVIVQDTTYDGMPDVVHKSHDYNQDGQIDSATTYVDTDGDGQYDDLTKVYDSTGDGVIDTVEHYTDSFGMGDVDSHEVYYVDATTGQLIPAMAAGFEVGGTYYTELENFHPDDNYPEDIIGDPKESMNHWECQGQTNRCALFSQKFVIEELDPNIDHIDIEEFAQVAKEHGWFTEEGGTSLLNMNNMLDYYGIDNEMSFHNSIEDIEECLNNGGKVIVSIDSDEIWLGEDDNIFAPDSSSDHAVEVIGIDRTDPDHPMVILNDSGLPSGRGEMVPLEVFEGAWEDGDCQMIKCYPSK